jgi:hypothetical protein
VWKNRKAWEFLQDHITEKYIMGYYSIFQLDWWLKHAPITCTVACMAVREKGENKETEHIAVPDIALENTGFQ